MTPRRKSDQGNINQTEINTEHQGTNSISWNGPYKLQEAGRQFPWHRHDRFMWSRGPGAGEMLEVEGDGSALHAIKNLCLSGLSNSLGAALGGCHKSAHPCTGDWGWQPSWFKIIFHCVFFFLPPGTAAEPQPCFSCREDQGIRSSKGLRALPQTQTLLNGMAVFSSSSSSDTTALNLVFKAYWDVSWLHQMCTGWKGLSHWSIGGHGSGVGNVLQAAHEVPGRCSHKPTACLVES